MKLSEQVRWLWTQSDAWVEQGLISQDQAQRIRGLYPAPKATLPWGMIIFSSLGAITAGLGVILLLAYNWQAIPKFAKLAIILGSLAGLHASGLWLWTRGDGRRPVGEAVCLFGTMLFGAGIWLVAQIYHIDEHYPNGFLIWGLGALALAWAMPSLAQGFLAAAVLCAWGCTEGWGFNHALHVAPLLLLAGVGSLAWKQRSPLLLGVVLAAFALNLLANISAVSEHLLLRTLLGFAVLFVAVGLLNQRRGWFSESVPVWNFFGWFGFLVCLYLLTFPDITSHLLGSSHTEFRSEPVQAVYEWLPVVLALGAWGAVAWPWRPGTPSATRPQDCRFEYVLLPLTVILAQVLAVAGLGGVKWEVAGVFNLVFLAVAAAWMARGCREGELRPTVLGSLLLAALTAARYFDLFESLALRGVIFLTVGGLLFAEGILFRRARQRVQPKEVSL